LIVVLTSSHELSDRERGHDLDAAHYVTKPIGLDVLAGELKLVEALARRRRS
jgi:DNA-binding response OmpR family regulator